MTSRPNGSGGRFPLLVSNLPTGARRRLAEELDDSGKWRDLAREMNYGLDTIQSIEDQMHREDVSATIELLDRWVAKNPSVKVDDMFIFLGKFEHKTAMLMLKDYVTPQLLSLIPNISQAESKQMIRERLANNHNFPPPSGRTFQVQPEIVATDGRSQLPNVGPPRSRPVFPSTAPPVRPLSDSNGARLNAPFITSRLTPMYGPNYHANHSCYVQPHHFQPVVDAVHPLAINGETGHFMQPSVGAYHQMNTPMMIVDSRTPIVHPIQPTAHPRMRNTNGHPGHHEHRPSLGLLPPSPPPSGSSSTAYRNSCPPSGASAGDNAASDSDDNKATIIDEERRRNPAAEPTAPDSIGDLSPADSEPPLAALHFPHLLKGSTMKPIAGTVVHQQNTREGHVNRNGTEAHCPSNETGVLIPPGDVPPMTTAAYDESPTVPQLNGLPSDVCEDNDLELPPYSELPPQDHITEVVTWGIDPDTSDTVGASQPPLAVGRHLMLFEYHDLQDATKDFSTDPSVMIGEGGYGTVYRANLRCGNYVVKRFFPTQKREAVLLGLQTVENFMRELEALERYRHENLLPLIGYSQDGPQLCLVYEYMLNGDLATWLFSLHGQRRYRGVLTARERINIAKGIAEALRFLHEAPEPAIHCNVRSSNILLDKNMSPHLADFGHVRQKSALSNHDRQTQLHTRSRYMVTSAAYIDPDVHLSKLDPLVDVYSLGVVMLEMLTGSPAAKFDNQSSQPDLISTMTEPIYGARECPDDLLCQVDKVFNDIDVEMRLRFAEVIGMCINDRQDRVSSTGLVVKFGLLFRDLLTPC